MNQYGRRAQRYWQQNLPRQYSQIEDPEAFFTQMGQTLAEQIDALTEEIEEQAAPPSEDFMANLGQLNRARQEAEMEVFRQMLPQPETAPPESPTAS